MKSRIVARRRCALRLVAEELEPRLVLSTVPVVFIPGFDATSPDPGDFLNFTLNRGASPAPLKLSASYDPLVSALNGAGYKTGLGFFGATFDFRMPIAPTNPLPSDPTLKAQGITLTSLTAENMTIGVRTGQFPYAVDYLGYWLDQVVQANPGVTQVDMVTHSTGGFWRGLM